MVANFPYSFPDCEREAISRTNELNNERLLFLKNKDDMNGGDEFATFIWKRKEFEYQLLYRCRENDENVIKQNLLYIAIRLKWKN